MKKRTMASVRVSAFAHATENPEKVVNAILLVLSGGSRQEVQITAVRGHHGNDILICQIAVRGRSQSMRFLEALSKRLANHDRAELLNSLDKRVDSSGNLHLRFDKQDAFIGRLVLASADPIKVEVSSFSAIRQNRSRSQEGVRRVHDQPGDPLVFELQAHIEEQEE